MSKREIAPRVNRANRNRAMRGRSWVYFARDRASGFIKIGQSRQVHRRMHTLTASTPQGVDLLGTVPETWCSESTFHTRFRRARVKGEWFEPTDEILAVAAAGERVFGAGYVDATDDDEAFALIRGWQ